MSGSELKVGDNVAVKHFQGLEKDEIDFLKSKPVHTIKKIDISSLFLEGSPIRFYKTDRVLMFQYSGDKFLADGVFANVEKTRLSELDLNKWVNKNITIEQIYTNQP